MDEILYLEPDEEITSVIDKIKNAKSGRLGLVIPRDATILQSVVNLRLLQREAAHLGKNIAVVTTDKIGRALASQVGLEVFSSVEERKPVFEPQPPKPDASEVIELDMAAKESTQNQAPGVHVHHFQEKPIIWRKNEAPVLKSSAKESTLPHRDSAKPTVGNFLAQKEKDIRFFRKIIWPLLIIILILIAIGVYLLLPKATVTVYTPSSDLQKEVVLAVSSVAKNPDFANNVLPGNLLSATDEKKSNFPATGKKNIGTKASGTITLYNSLDSSGHSLSAGAQLSSSSKTFVLKSAVTIPGAGVSGGSVVPGTVKADIEANDVGADYNVKAGRFTILSLSATQQAGIYGQSSQDLSGGASKQVQVVSQSDYDNAKNQLISDLTNSTNTQLQQKINGAKVIDKTTVVADPVITTTANVNAEAQNFDMDVKFSQQVMVFDQSQMKNFLVQILSKDAPTDKIVAIPTDSNIGYIVKNTAYDKQELDLTANVSAKIAAKIDTNKIKTAILGKSISSAQSYISGTPNITKETIDISPALWFKRMPNLSRNVTVKINYEGQ